MSFASTGLQSAAPTIEHFPTIMDSIKRHLASVEQALPSLSKLPRTKRQQVHKSLQAASTSAESMERVLGQLKESTDSATKKRWEKLLESQVSRIRNLLNNVMRIEDALVTEQEQTQETDSLLQQTQEQKVMRFDIQLHHDIIYEREEKINQLSQNIHIVNDMMKDLADMVCSQGEFIDLFEQNIEQSAENSKKAVLELSKADEGQKKLRHRFCMLCLLAGLALFVVTLIGVNFR